MLLFGLTACVVFSYDCWLVVLLTDFAVDCLGLCLTFPSSCEGFDWYCVMWLLLFVLFAFG